MGMWIPAHNPVYIGVFRLLYIYVGRPGGTTVYICIRRERDIYSYRYKREGTYVQLDIRNS